VGILLMLPCFLPRIFRLRAFRHNQCEHPDSLWKPSSPQTSAKHSEQCAEFPLLRNRRLGPLAVAVLPIAVARRAAATCVYRKLDPY
jgi:hypothetical protein